MFRAFWSRHVKIAERPKRLLSSTWLLDRSACSMPRLDFRISLIRDRSCLSLKHPCTPGLQYRDSNVYSTDRLLQLMMARSHIMRTRDATRSDPVAGRLVRVSSSEPSSSGPTSSLQCSTQLILAADQILRVSQQSALLIRMIEHTPPQAVPLAGRAALFSPPTPLPPPNLFWDFCFPATQHHCSSFRPREFPAIHCCPCDAESSAPTRLPRAAPIMLEKRGGSDRTWPPLGSAKGHATALLISYNLALPYTACLRTAGHDHGPDSWRSSGSGLVPAAGRTVFRRIPTAWLAGA